MSALFLFSCSTSEENQTDNETVVNANVKLLKSVTETNDTGDFCSFYYENNRLTKINLGELENYMEVQQLSYENDKITKFAYNGGYADRYNNVPVNPEDFTYNYDLNNSQYLETISYTNNSIFYNLYRAYTFNLNNQKQVVSILENNDLAQEFVYSNNQIVKQKNFKNPSAEYSFVFDDKINPFYVLYTKFGLLQKYICPYLGHSYLYYFLMPNNVTKVYKDGTLLFSFIYQYDVNNYPISAVAYDYSDKTTHTYSYVYTK
jgi:hypothetical protein